MEIGSLFVVAGKFYYDRKKKDTAVCLAGARSLLRPEKKSSIYFVVAGKFYYDRKKKDTVLCLAGARSLLRPEKKSRLSGGCAIIITTGKQKDTVVCLVGARS